MFLGQTPGLEPNNQGRLSGGGEQGVEEGQGAANLKRSNMKFLCARPWLGICMTVFPVLKTTWETGTDYHL